MGRSIYVNCGFCKGLMEVDSETGDVLKKWSAKEKPADGDVMGAALRKMEEDKKKRASLLEDTKGEMEAKRKKMEDVFRKEVDRVKKEGFKEPPMNPFDRD
jgi:hypothetical protein